MKEHKIELALFFINTALFAILATIDFYDNNISTAIIYTIVSVLFLVSGLSALKKIKTNKKEHKVEVALYFIDTALFAVIATMGLYDNNISTAIIYVVISVLFFISGLSALKKLTAKRK